MSVSLFLTLEDKACELALRPSYHLDMPLPGSIRAKLEAASVDKTRSTWRRHLLLSVDEALDLQQYYRRGADELAARSDARYQIYAHASNSVMHALKMADVWPASEREPSPKVRYLGPPDPS